MAAGLKVLVAGGTRAGREQVDSSVAAAPRKAQFTMRACGQLILGVWGPGVVSQEPAPEEESKSCRTTRTSQ